MAASSGLWPAAHASKVFSAFEHLPEKSIHTHAALGAKLIHAALQPNEAVTTYSTGNEPNRKVIVALAGTEPKENAGQVKKTGSARRSGGHKRSRGRRPAKSAQ